LKQQAHQNMRRGVSRTFVLVPAEASAEIAGFYTLALAEVSLANLQPGDAKPLPPYPVPCFRMGRLARDQRLQGQGLGPLLLGLAVHRCHAARRSVGGYALVVDANNPAAVAFYAQQGFLPFQGAPQSFYLPLGS
jgi:GNAT superfamily N-acetyltransferase